MIPEIGVNLTDHVQDIQDLIDNGEIKTIEALRAAIFSKFIAVYSSAGSNNYRPLTYHPNSWRDPEIFNENQINIAICLDRLFTEYKVLTATNLGNYSLLTNNIESIGSKTSAIRNKLKQARSKIEERQFLSQGQSVQIIADSFDSTALIDWTKSKITIDVTAGTSTLPVKDNVSRSSNVKDVKVTNINKNTNGSSIYDQDKFFASPMAYEGFRFSSANQTRPEAGIWQIETKNLTIDTLSPTLKFNENYTNLVKDTYEGELLTQSGTSITTNSYTGKKITPDEYLFDTEESAAAITNYDVADAGVVSRNDLSYVEIKATEEQLKTKRLEMFDGDPRTFWEIEYTPLMPDLATQLFEQSDADANNYSKYQVLAQEYLKNSSDSELTCTLVIELDNVYTLNYIDLIPVFFSSADDANYEITEILTQSGENQPLEGIPNFESFDNIIGRYSNSSISKQNMQEANVFNKFSFKGKGVWTFPKRRVKYIHISFKQDYAIPNPYLLKNVQLLKQSNYSINESKSASKQTQSGFSSSNDSSSKSANALERGKSTRLLQFGYLETLASDLNSSSTSLLAGASSSSSVTASTAAASNDAKSKSTGGIFTTVAGAIAPGITAAATSDIGASTGTGVVTPGPGQALAASAITAATVAAGVVIDNLLSGSSGGSSSSNVSQSYNDTGFQVNSEYYRTMWARARYAIGVADIGLYVKTYEVSGVLYSLPFLIGAGNKRITVSVSEQIPISFLNFDPQKAWIEYYLVINDKEYRVNPEVGTISSEGHINFPSFLSLKELSSSSSVFVRFLAKYYRPLESQLLNADSETVECTGYEIKVVDLG